LIIISNAEEKESVLAQKIYTREEEEGKVYAFVLGHCKNTLRHNSTKKN